MYLVNFEAKFLTGRIVVICNFIHKINICYILILKYEEGKLLFIIYFINICMTNIM